MSDPQVEPAAEPASPTDRLADDALALHRVRPRTGLTPLIWAGVLILIVIAVLIWELM